MANGEALILVVDDDEDIRETVESVLAEAGYAVATAANGEDALAILRGAGPLPRLILLDLMMPVMSGGQFRTAQQQDERLRAIPTVLLSGDPHLEEIASTTAAAAWVRKPITLRALLSIARRFSGVVG